MKKAILTTLFLMSSATHAKILTPYEVEKMGQYLMDSKKVVGLSVAVITPAEDFIVHLGETRRGSGTKPTSNSVYEIASISKALTGTLAAQLILEGKLKESHMAQGFLKTHKLSKQNTPIPVLDLLTQSSGLPTFYPESAYKPKDAMNPWAGFGAKNVYALLKNTELHFAPGAKYEYSNIGAAITGYVLEALEKKTYEQILRDRLTVPLALKDTGITLSEEQSKRLVQGYMNDGAQFVAAPKWDMSGVAAAGAVTSTMNDMVILVKGLLDGESSHGKAFEHASRPLRSAGPDMSIGYFWHVDEKHKFVWHNGSTFGMSSAVVISKDKKSAVIVLTNTFTGKGDETALAFALLTQAVAE